MTDEINEENLEEGLDNGSEISDTVGIESEETVDDILGDILNKIDRLKALSFTKLTNAKQLRKEQVALKAQEKASEKESKRAGNIAKKLKNLIS